jgi:hypothetical protein
MVSPVLPLLNRLYHGTMGPGLRLACAGMTIKCMRAI